jgi:hypothetical protein
MSYDYFVRFAQSPEVYYMYDGDKLDALNYLGQFTDGNEVYLSQLWGDMHSTVYLLRRNLGIKSVDTANTIVLPPPGKGAIYAFPNEQLERAEQVAALWPGLKVESIRDPYGNVLLHTVRIDAKTAESWPAARHPAVERPASFQAAPALVGMQAANPDKQITLFWKADQPIAGNLTTFVQFIDMDGDQVAQADKLPGNGSYPTPVWTTGERVIDRSYPALTDLCAGGEPVRVQVGWYELRDGNPQRPRTDSSGTTALAGEITLAYFTYPLDKFQPGVTLGIPLSSTLTLEGYTLDQQELQAGSPLTIDLLWSSHDQNDKSAPGMTPVRLSLVGSDGTFQLWQGQIAPGSRWDNELALCRRIHASLPTDLPSGNYTITLDQPSVTATLPVTLGTVAISPSTRLYTVPPLARSVGITLTDSQNSQIALLGLRSEPTPDAATDQLVVDIVWQAASHIDANYKVFVHLLDSAGTIVAQSDAIPGDKGTSHWLPGEVILDPQILTLPPGLATSPDLQHYQIVAGLYDPIGMQRLTARRTDGSEIADGRVPLGSPILPSR